MIIVTKFLRPVAVKPQSVEIHRRTDGTLRLLRSRRWQIHASRYCLNPQFSPESGPPICGLMSTCPSQRIASIAKRFNLITLSRRSPSMHAVACEVSDDVRLDCLCRRDVGIAAGCVARLELGKSASIERTRQP